MRHSFFDRYSDLESPVHRLDARVKILLFLFLILLALTTPPLAARTFAGYFLLLVFLLLLSGVPPLHVFRRLLLVVPFILFATALLPFSNGSEGASHPSLAFLGCGTAGPPLVIFLNVVQKAGFSAFALLLLSSTTPFPGVLDALRALRVPRVFLLILAFLYRYQFLLVDEAERMVRALQSRGYRARNLLHAHVIGSLLGMFWLRSYERSERVYEAMASRGFNGNLPAAVPSRLTGFDLGLPAAVGLAAVLLRVYAR
jgi:cobalt/nickel transport system permease protein